MKLGISHLVYIMTMTSISELMKNYSQRAYDMLSRIWIHLFLQPVKLEKTKTLKTKLALKPKL